MKYAKKQGLPIFLVWSNGGSCSHCNTFKGAIQNKVFVDFMNKTKIVWCYMESSDKDAKIESKAFQFTRGIGGGNLKSWRAKDKSKVNTDYPYICLYWYNTRAKKPVISKDITAIGDQLDKKVDGKTGAKNIINWIKSKTNDIKKLGYDMSTATFTLS